jgi:aspartate carbamoyltransferase catalytic subunit
MYPSQRIDDINTEESRFPNAAYFRQAHKGVFVPIALPALVMGRA